MRLGFDAKRIFHNTTGLGNYSRDLVRILSEYYPKEEYLLYNPKKKRVDRLALSNQMQECVPKGAFWKRFNSLWRQKKIVKDLLIDRVEIYHGLTNELPRGIHKTNIKTVVTIHDLIFVRYPKLYSFFDRKIHFNKFKYAATVADKVIAISEQTKQDIVQYLKIDSDKIEVVYQGCHPIFKKQTTISDRKQVSEKYNLPSEYILNVGTIEPRKNLLSLIKAIKGTELKLVVIGKKTDYFKEIDLFLKQNNMIAQVVFLSGVSMLELATIYQLARLFVYPSVFEGFGIPIIEALYSKTPVITSKGSCFAEAGGKASVYVDPYDVSTLKNNILQVWTDKDLRQKMIEEGFEYVQKFNDTNIAEQWIKVYQSLTSR